MPDETADGQAMFYLTVPCFGKYREKYIRVSGTEQLLTARLESTPCELKIGGWAKRQRPRAKMGFCSVAFVCQQASKAVNDEQLDLLATFIFQMAKHRRQQ